MKALLNRLVRFTAAVAIVASVFAPGTPLPASVAQAQGVTGGGSASVGASVGTTNTGSTANSGNVTSTGNTGASTMGTDLECSTSNISLCISGFVYWITVGIGSWVANIAAYVFDYAVMLSLQSGAYALDVIAVGWGIVRDVANMSFLFILVYIAFKIMFQAETTGTTRMLVWVVIVALLVNFSFVMTRAVIDAGNIVALQFYNAIASVSPSIGAGQGQSSPVSGGIPVKDITASIMTALNPQGILGDGGQFKNFIASKSTSTMYYLIVSSVVYILMGVSLFMVAAVFIFAAVRFVTRVIGLAGLIMIAPAAFVAAIFRGKEGGAKWFNMWLGYLLEFTFYPAVFLFLFYIEIRFMQDMNTANSAGSLFNTAFRATGTAGEQSWTLIAQGLANVGVRLAYIIASLYLILRASQWSSQAFNKVGAGWISGKINSLNLNPLRLAGKGYARAGGLAYQQLVGRGAAAAANGMERRGLGSSFLGYRAKQGLNALAGTKLGGSRSFNQFKDTRDKELEERGKVRERGERRGAIQDMLGAKGRESDQASANAYSAGRQAAAEGLFKAAERERQASANQTTRRPEEAEAATIAAAWEKAVAGGRTPVGSRPEEKEADALASAWEKTLTQKPISVPASPTLAKALEQMDKDRAEKEAQEKRTYNTQGALSEALDELHGGKPSVQSNAGTSDNTTPPAAPAAVAPRSANDNQTLEELRGIKATQQSIFQLATNILNSSPKAPPAVVQSVTKRVEIRPAAGHEGVSREDLSKLAKEVAHKLEPKLAELESTLQSHGTGDGTPPSPAAPAAARPQNPENDNNPPPNPGLGGMQPLPKAA